MSGWKSIEREDLKLMNSISTGLSSYKDWQLPDFSGEDTLLLASDYSGEHREADFQVLTFLLVGSRSFHVWDRDRAELRRTLLRDGRRIAFKNLNDKYRRKCIVPFLDLANRLNGILFSVAIDKKLGSLFEIPDDFSPDNPWKTKSFEKMLRILHFASLLLSGFSHERQNVFWISDDDDIVANTRRIKEVTKYLERICTAYLAHDMGHLRLGTAGGCDIGRQAEDFVAIPDLAGGAISEHISLQHWPLPEKILVPPNIRASPKTAMIMTWFAFDESPLKRVLCTILPGKKCLFHIQWVNFPKITNGLHRGLWLPMKHEWF